MTVSSLAAWRTAAAVHPAAPGSAAAAQEQELIARGRLGDRDALETIYTRYETAVYRHALFLTENADDADDIRQETFVRAFGALGRFRNEANFKTYLLAICGNLCRDRLRRKMRRPQVSCGLTLPIEVPADSVGDPLAALERAASARTVQNALRRLSPDDRRILLLRHIEELEYDEIAVALGCSRGSAPVRLFRARQRFKTIFLALQKCEQNEGKG